jgi:cysteinyl-tRNA synthetase
VLNVYNTLTGKKELFVPIDGKHVKMYSCGPSTYQRAHIGNYRTFLFEDVLQRYLEYSGYTVTRLITLTDVEDKALIEAEKEQLPVKEITQRNEATFLKELKILKIKIPDFTIKASSAVDQAAHLIKILKEKGYAYSCKHTGRQNVYFDPLKFSGFGKLAKLDMTKWPKKKRRFHKDTYPGTPWNKGDFILWHGCQDTDRVCWDTEIGRGRPAWNIQDAAIITKHLGFQVDVACGGIDNLFRHHDYTLAISESISGKNLANYWLHGGHLYVEGAKMSKSKGNIYFLEDLMAKGFSADHVRFFLIYGQYKRRMNFTFKKLLETSQRLDSFKKKVEQLEKGEASHSTDKTRTLVKSLISGFKDNMNNDLDVKGAFDDLYEKVAELNELSKRKKLGDEDANTATRDLHEIDKVLQVIF